MHVLDQLDPRQRKQVLDQPRHARGLRLHDGEEAGPRGRVLARRAEQRVDEARERGERRAQLVARIGDEVRAHLFGAVQRREIVERQQHQRPRGADRMDVHLEPAVDRNALRELDAARAAGGRDLAHRLDDFRNAQRQRGRRAARERRRDQARGVVERHHPALAVEHDRGVGHAGNQGVEQAVAGIRIGRGRRIERAATATEQPAEHHDVLSYFLATPSHNSRTPRIRSESANGTI